MRVPPLRPRQVTRGQVRGRAGDAALHVVALPASLLGLARPVLDEVEVAVEEVDAGAVDYQPRAAVHQPPPLARLDDRSLEAERSYVVGVDAAAVVEAEVPVASGLREAGRARAQDRKGDHARYLRQTFGERLHAGEPSPPAAPPAGAGAAA